MPIRLALSSARAGEWHITSEGTYLVGFSGPHARELAVQRQQELAQLLDNLDADKPPLAPERPRPFLTIK
jgi:hypothetical protein